MQIFFTLLFSKRYRSAGRYRHCGVSGGIFHQIAAESHAKIKVDVREINRR